MTAHTLDIHYGGEKARLAAWHNSPRHAERFVHDDVRSLRLPGNYACTSFWEDDAVVVRCRWTAERRGPDDYSRDIVRASVILGWCRLTHLLRAAQRPRRASAI